MEIYGWVYTEAMRAEREEGGNREGMGKMKNVDQS